MVDRFEPMSNEQAESARPRWRTPQLTVSTVEDVTKTGFTPGPDGTTYPTLHGS